MELYFDLTDLVAQDAKTARLKCCHQAPGASVLVDSFQRSSPRIDHKLQQSHVMSEAVYGRTTTAIINCNSGRSSAISAPFTPNVSRIFDKMEPSVMIADKENSICASLATFKSTLRSTPPTSGRVRNPFQTRERPLVPKIQRMPVSSCPDNWIPSHTCDDFCRNLLLNI